MIKMKRKVFFLITCLAATPVAAGAETIESRPERPVYRMEVMHPSYTGLDTKLYSGAYVMSGRIPIGTSSNVMNFELPFSYMHDSNEFLEENTSSSIGNPMIGMTLGGEGNRDIEFGLRLNMADDAEMSNMYAAFADLSRWEAYVPSLWSMYGQVRWQRATNGLLWELNVGPNVWMPEEGDVEMWAIYGAGVGYAGKNYRLAARTTGRLWMTQDGLNIDERTNHQVGLFADFGKGNWRPGMELRLPVDRNSEIESTWGVSLKYTMD
jgi:hypothetical protein